MEYNLNKISCEEQSDKATKIFESLVTNTSNCRYDDAAEIVGIALSYYISQLEKSFEGKISKDDIISRIYHITAKCLKYNIN